MEEKIEFYRETEFKDTEIGKIPKEWEVVKLKDTCKLIRGTEPGSKTYNIIGKGFRFIRVSDISKQVLDTVFTDEKPENLVFCHKDDVLLALDGVPGVVAKRVEGAISSGIRIVKPNNNIYKEFLFYILQCSIVQKIINDNTTGSTIKHAARAVNFIKLVVPPLKEQQKIAEILSTIDEAIQKTDDIIANTERLKKGLMQELLTKGMGHREFKDTEIGKIPKEWEIRRLAEIGELSRGLSYGGQEKFAKEVSGGYLFFTLNSIKEGGGLKDSGWSWIRTDRVKERHFVKKGDIVIANTDIGMQRGHILGAPAIIYFPKYYKEDKAVFSHHISKLLLRISNIDVNFLFYYLSFIQPLARKYHTGTGVWGLNVDSWARDLLIPLPSLAEQQEISEILSDVDEKLETFKLEKIKLKKIKQWFMEELLSGRIRVRVT